MTTAETAIFIISVVPITFYGLCCLVDKYFYIDVKGEDLIIRRK